MSTILPSDVTDDGGGMTSSALSHRDRLVQFYTEHNPSKIPSIESLLKKYEGDEEALIQKVHLKYDVRDVVSHEAVDDLFENERYSYLNMSFGSTYPGHLLVLDRKRWSRASGSPSSQDMHQVELTLPEGYEWTGPWEIDSSYCNCDREGWTYAFDFSKYDYHLMHFTPSTPPLCLLTLPSYSHSFKSMLLNDESHDTAGMADYVRWIHRVRTARVVRWRLTKAKLRAQLATLPHKTLQSKRDLVQRAIWFPHEKGYIWRASVGGMFVGLKDFWVERLELSFSLTCTTSQVVVIFHGAFCGQFDGVKVKGDKGTRIPNAKWTQVDVDMHFRGLGIPDALAQLVLEEIATHYITHVVATSLPSDLAELLLRPGSGVEESGFVQHLHMHMEGKITGGTTMSDALMRVQLKHVTLNARGPIDWTSSLAWARSIGRVVVVSPSDTLPSSVTVTFEMKPQVTTLSQFSVTDIVGPAITATLTSIQSKVVLDATHLTGDVAVCTIDCLDQSPSVCNTFRMLWHDALRAKLSVGAVHVVANMRAMCDVVMDQWLHPSTTTLHTSTRHWLAKLVQKMLKYCLSDALLVAWSVETSLDEHLMWTCDTVTADHPQPLMYFDQLQLLTVLHDVDELVAFSIHLHDSPT
ncbi:hypothetical protein DYB36_008777 [Aphanomyces astaci]|uniref:Uncharacterized protein n=1 Tax=Aphanomyces astaci TaxID=112090 RepID=A0A397ASU6_APHAT|nr:hypothetical protein DYB36_008777 [Aphanomyces astaci]